MSEWSEALTAAVESLQSRMEAFVQKMFAKQEAAITGRFKFIKSQRRGPAAIDHSTGCLPGSLADLELERSRWKQREANLLARILELERRLPPSSSGTSIPKAKPLLPPPPLLDAQAFPSLSSSLLPLPRQQVQMAAIRQQQETLRLAQEAKCEEWEKHFADAIFSGPSGGAATDGDDQGPLAQSPCNLRQLPEDVV
ncbi:hypothetical protein BC829DRAFT_443942 [Chytridium lagenaria]|nr:hypothetical protein BC829DRAFT_443942 [Chytridium lagenaria]